MNKLMIFLWGFIITLIIQAAQAEQFKVDCSSETTFCNVKYNDIYDGDTFYVDIPKLHPLLKFRFGIRVRGIDAPEIRTKNKFEKEQAYKAKEALEKILVAGKIRLYNCSKGKYFRLVCDAQAGNVESISKWMLDNSHALPYDK